jgi:aldehyde:ferredoxin oxidoreductase
MIGGWTGKVLRVDLTHGKITTEPLREDWAREYVGGRGLGARYLWEEGDPQVDPLSPENKLLFVNGPLTGTNASCAARYMVVTKGPLTGAITTSNSGGHWGPELKCAGYDMIIIEGRAASPSYLWIYNDQVEIRGAQHLWGKGVWETEETLRAECGVPDAIIASIGQAGENLVRYAAIMNDLHRAAGRSGVGAVMGSKNLKAIAVRGTGGVRLADPKAFMKASWEMKAKLKDSAVTAEGLPTYGTESLVNVINEHGALPTRNHQETVFEKAEEISGETLTETRLVANKACFACTIACGRITVLPGEAADKFRLSTSPRNWNIAGEGPEYESAWAMGADCGIGDLDPIIKAGWLCNDYGMDPITYGATLAAAMEMYETGAIDESLTGMPLEFGSGEALVAMAEKVAFREGIGDELAEGSKRFTARYGRPDLFMGVRGQEFPAYDARAVQGMGLGYATSNRGACHLRAYTVSPEILGIPEKMDPHVSEGKAEITKIFQDISSVVDSAGLCLFLTFGVGLDDMLPQLVAATGVGYDMDTLTQAGERIWNLERLWNERAGVGKGFDVLPKRLMTEPIPSGPAKGLVSKLDVMLPEYYERRGWTPDGLVTPEKRKELGLPDD